MIHFIVVHWGTKTSFGSLLQSDVQTINHRYCDVNVSFSLMLTSVTALLALTIQLMFCHKMSLLVDPNVSFSCWFAFISGSFIDVIYPVQMHVNSIKCFGIMLNSFPDFLSR